MVYNYVIRILPEAYMGVGDREAGSFLDYIRVNFQ